MSLHPRTRLAVGAARLVPHPPEPTARLLARLRRAPGPLARAVTGHLPRSVVITERRVRVDSRPLRLRFHRPRPRPGSARLGLVINFHGGGFVLGNPQQMDWLCAHVADEVGALVVSPAYRLAPEHPAPSSVHDALAVTDWLLDHAPGLGADPTRAAVMGASAGGTLAALVALARRDSGVADSTPLRGQVLLYPATDLTLSSPSVEEFDRGPIVSRDVLEWFGRHYLPESARLAADDPSISPIHHADHSGLPPALVVVAGQDALRDDGLRYAEVLQSAGVECRTEVHPDTIHGFLSMPGLCPPARPARGQVIDFLRTRLAP